MRLTDLIPSQIKIIVGVVAVAGLAGSLGYVHHHIAKGGYDRCRAEVAATAQTAKDKAQSNVTKVEKTYAPKIKKLQEAPDSGGAVGPLTTRAIDGL